MTRSNVNAFSAYVAAVGLGLAVSSLWFGAEIAALTTKRTVDIWDFFLGAGIVLVAIGGPLYLITSAGRFLLGPD
ncbi:MAG: hypothetical protein ACQEQY_08375 [Halobacteriota archaeon]